jgi:hypothetical protein
MIHWLFDNEPKAIDINVIYVMSTTMGILKCKITMILKDTSIL